MIRRAKILYVVNVFGGAVSRILMDIMPRLVKIFNVKIVSIQPFDNSERLIGEFIKKYNNLESLNVNRFSLLKAYRNLNYYFNKIGPDIIHSHMGRADIFTAISRPKNIIIMNTLHCEKRNHTLMTQISYRLTDNRVDWRICISETVARSYYNHGLKSPHSIIYNPVNIKKLSEPINRMELRKHMGFDKDDKILINVGRLIKSKGQRHLIEMMPYLRRLLPQVKLLIIGSGPQYNSLRDLINKYYLQNNIYLLGYRQDVQDLLKMSDLFVYSAQWEGLGVAVIEAMVAGIPILAHPLPALKEYIVNDQNGFFCDVLDKNNFANKVYDVLINYQDRLPIVTNAQKKVNMMFSAEKISNQYIKLYQQLLSNINNRLTD